MTENGWHNTDIRVRYKDTDRMGVVYYGNYLTYFEVGRSEYMRELGFPYSQMEGKGYILVVTEANARYRSNVGYDSLITVKTAITEVKRIKVRFDYEIFSSDNILLVTGYTVHGCLNPDMKPIRIPEELVKRMQGRLINRHEEE
ncbi:MAG: acyl-CoA thioesterase [Deltaproteobacteria bacterium]|nr:acyl-CoA thioesterase [Deltaproteobacteria bacterium]